MLSVTISRRRHQPDRGRLRVTAAVRCSYSFTFINSPTKSWHLRLLGQGGPDTNPIKDGALVWDGYPSSDPELHRMRSGGMGSKLPFFSIHFTEGQARIDPAQGPAANGAFTGSSTHSSTRPTSVDPAPHRLHRAAPRSSRKPTLTPLSSVPTASNKGAWLLHLQQFARQQGREPARSAAITSVHRARVGKSY